MSPMPPASLPAGRAAVATLATLAAFSVFAWVVAHWTWRALAPAPVPTPRPAPADPATAIVASGLWAPTTSEPPAPKSAPASAGSGELTLLGVMAERDGRGWGVFRTKDGARVVAAGDEVVSGTTLVGVDPNGVRVRESSGERTLELRREPASSSAKRETGARGPVRPTNPACAVPQGYAGSIVKLHAELVEGMIAQPETWRTLLAAEGGALVVREDGGFAALLGLARGDRVSQANGVALREVDDVIAAVMRPLAASQPVRLSGQRAGRPRDVLLQNAGACP